MVAFLTRMPAGIAGAITRPLESTIEPALLYRPTDPTPALSPTEYGSAVVIDATTKRWALPIAASTAAQIAFLPRPYPGGLAQQQGVLGVTPVDTVHVGDVMRRGYMNVKLRLGAAVKGGAVFVRVQNPVGVTQPVGGIEAAADGANTVQLDSKTYFTGAAFTDPNFGTITEIAFDI